MSQGPTVIDAHLPIGRTLLVSYRDWRRFLLAQRAIVLCGFLIIVAIATVAAFEPPSLSEQILSGSILDVVEDAVWALLLTPVVIAVHRFVIQDVNTSGYRLPLGDPVYRLFFVWMFALKVVAELPFTLLGVMQLMAWPLLASTAGFVVALVAAIALALRLIILLPAIAVQAPAAAIAPALADSRGQVLPILAVFMLALVPWFIPATAVALALGRGAEVVGSPRAMIDLLTTGILQTATLTLSATIAAHLFRSLGNAVNRAPKLALKPSLANHSRQ